MYRIRRSVQLTSTIKVTAVSAQLCLQVISLQHVDRETDGKLPHWSNTENFIHRTGA